MRKGLFLAFSLALVLGSAKQSAAADVVLFDPKGTSGANALLLDTFDWLPGNDLLVEHTPYVVVGLPDSLTGPGGILGGPQESNDILGTATVYYQANLGTLKLGGSGVFAPSTNCTGGGDCFFQAVAAIDVVFYQLGANASFFLDTSVGATNFFKIFANDNNANELSPLSAWGDDTCFVCGKEILTASAVLDSFSINTVVTDPDDNVTVGSTEDGSIVNGKRELDQTSDGNNYVGVTSLDIQGATSINASVSYADPAYFLNLINNITIALNNGNLDLPFGGANPSECFDADGLLGTAVCEGGALSVGAINGTTNRIMLQADANSQFQNVAQVVPEPATLTLLGFGLLGSAAARRRQAKGKKK